MKTIGIIGGMSPESTALYYHLINRAVNAKLGGNHSAEILLFSVNFEQIAQHQRNAQWNEAGKILADAARKLENIGADFIILATNTMHKVAHHIENAINIPFLHVVDVLADEIKSQGKQTVGLLGTQFTMSDSFYIDRLKHNGITVMTPNETEQAEIHRIIFEELCVNKILPQSKQIYLDIIRKLEQQGAQGIILGCTEIGLLIKQKDYPLPLFDTTEIHSLAAVDFALTSPRINSAK